MSISDITVIIRLALAFLLGGLIGLERETHGRAAGLRTHILVCLGSTLIMIVSALAFPKWEFLDADPSRIAAQVVSGIGFLGAGTILREGSSIRGLTTAASLWVAAGIGLAIGGGLYYASIVSTILVLLSLRYLSKVERRIAKNTKQILTVRLADKPGQLGQIASLLGDLGIHIEEVDIEHGADFTSTLEIAININPNISKFEVIEGLRKLEGVYEVSFS